MILDRRYRHWCCEGPCYQSSRDPRADDPDYYWDLWIWVKRTEWTADNEPDWTDGVAYRRYLQETTPAQRAAITSERMRLSAR